MSMRSLESAIINELREIVGKRSLRLKDVMEWSTSEDVVRKNALETETVIHVPDIGVWAAVDSSAIPKYNAQEHRRSEGRAKYGDSDG